MQPTRIELKPRQRIVWDVDPLSPWYVVSWTDGAVLIEDPDGHREHAHRDDLTGWTE